MIKRLVYFVLSTLIFVVLANVAIAEEPGMPKVKPAHPDHKSSVNLTEQATDPSAILTQLGFFYSAQETEGAGADSNSSTFLFQPVLPLTKSNVLRPALPILNTAGPGSVSGIGDLFILDAFMFQVPNATWGIGPVASLPTATNDALGTGKYQLGIDALYIYKGIPKNIFGILAYNQWSVAGDSDREDVNKLSFQPIWVKHFDGWYLGWSDQTATVDWENDSNFSFPIGLRFGKVFAGKMPLNIAIEPYYVYNDFRDNDYGVKLGVTFVMPKWLNH